MDPNRLQHTSIYPAPCHGVLPIYPSTRWSTTTPAQSSLSPSIRTHARTPPLSLTPSTRSHATKLPSSLAPPTRRIRATSKRQSQVISTPRRSQGSRSRIPKAVRVTIRRIHRLLRRRRHFPKGTTILYRHQSSSTYNKTLFLTHPHYLKTVMILHKNRQPSTNKLPQTINKARIHTPLIEHRSEDARSIILMTIPIPCIRLKPIKHPGPLKIILRRRRMGPSYGQQSRSKALCLR